MDDLLDLNWSTQPSSTSTQSNSRKPSPSPKTTFDYLSSATLSSPSYSTSSPNLSRSSSPFVAPTTTSQYPPRTTPAPTPSAVNRPKSTGSGDAFSSLFGSNSSSPTTAGLSMAERLAKENGSRLGGSSSAFGSKAAASNGNGSRAASPATHQQQQRATSSRGSSFNVPAAPRATPSPAPSLPPSRSKPGAATAPDPWDFDLLSTASPAALSPAPAKADPFDAFSFDDSPPLPPSTSSKQPPSRQHTSSTTSSSSSSRQHSNLRDTDDLFDRTREESLLSQSSDDDGGSEDILGILSRPVSSKPPPSSTSSQQSRSRPPPLPRTASPPPHILGQLVSMGFDIAQSRAALEATSGPGGWDVEAATEVLLEEQRVEERAEEELRGRREAERVARGEVENGGERRRRGEERRVENRRGGSHTEPVSPQRPRRGASGRDGTPSTDPTAKVQEHAAELLAQASKLGFSVFKSANAYWETGRATIQKRLAEEGLVAGGRGSGSGAASGRPRWMTEEVPTGQDGIELPPTKSQTPTTGSRPRWMTEEDPPEDQPPSAPKPRTRKQHQPTPSPSTPPLFQDSDTEDQDPVLLPHPSERKHHPPQPRHPSREPSPQPPPPQIAPIAEYKSPWRRAKASPSPSPAPTPSAPAIPTPTARPSPPTIAPKPKRVSKPRPVRPTLTSQQLSSSTSYKTTGNEMFKVGRFGDAEHSYTLAVDALPEKSLARVTVLNNRASARSKVGNENGVVEDCSEVLEILLGTGRGVVGGTGVNAEEDLEEDEVDGVKIKEQFGKALARRAKANEVKEKWVDAEKDWQVLGKARGDGVVRGAGGLKIINEGLGRCRKMLSPSARSTPSASSTSTTPRQPPPVQPKLKPIPTQTSTATVESSTAVQALRTAAEAAATEDDLRLSLKDSVDARIAAWKGGKESNLRALIASLDAVLWPELEWKKVGMHELISEGQVKIRYVRAIAKVHPDKLNVNNTTVEQRMIAGAVFSGLNDAWNASKS